ncbi:MAG TPA: indolepyruvate ferredoxin oxidoreductase family protein [Hypericibacter adhaerens]|uniref:indolepyruvate ferredoxin oxidoreductase family protein n=1 Tax=Hypericibacter adhaerens TaxID=2602016 RepID=UPI002C11316C|nr:indolepyruvate ferredoxin oxidoreductase family protein [Hypericibacter adhaerens]HWA45269.1 indolepyruvate ferredoxin oxidoreductase family protein [Hypericibacter adhaerens]
MKLAPASKLATVSLDDKYAAETGRVFLTGTQALVRLPMMQRRRDEAAGLNTAAFITGYRGSPLGGLDLAMGQAKKFLDRHHIRFQAGVNEDLAATAVWGSQQLDLFGDSNYDGVFALWYGKGPGVDRSGDALRHANLAGTAKHGGVLALAGDDHTCKSSTTAHQTEYAFVDAQIPVLNPAGVQEFLDLGLHGVALSRYSGCWVALKCVADTVESSASVSVDPHRVQIATPTDFEMPAGGLNIRFPSSPFASIQALEQEMRLHRYKLKAVLAYARANKLDRAVIDGPRRRLGIVTTGKSYLDLRQALDDLGIDEAHAEEVGLSVYKVGLVWPLEPEGLKKFAEGLEEILVVEEKRPLIEDQIKTILYDAPAGRRPRVIGKFDEKGEWILPSADELTPAMIARVLARRIKRFYDSPRIEERLAFLETKEKALEGYKPAIRRIAYFCSGCPHNTSTRVPEGSRALAGIGCHYMAQWMDRDTQTFTQMGGEGATWIGQAPFSKTPHVFQNLGDGTYFHSGSLAIRAAIGAGVNITYKLLYNDAVAMTGGQHVDGPLDVPQVTRQLAAEGVGRICLVTDQPELYEGDSALAPGTEVHHRDQLDAVQRSLRETPGVTALVYAQTCAAEKRRRRKRGLMEDPAKRVVINERVCEGCGDCSKQSNCLSVVPVETEFGRKRAIDQSSCNKDFSCVKGFCPSFVTVKGGKLRKRRGIGGKESGGGKTGDLPPLPEPQLPGTAEPYGILVTGVGGTGVVTVGALIGMAAHIEGKGCSILDMTGLAQKGGAVISHLRIADRPEDIHAVRIAAGGARVLLACDIVVGASYDALAKLHKGVSRALINVEESITGDFTRNPDLGFPVADLKRAITDAVGRDEADFVDATRLATALLGDSIASNLFMLGYAYQKGLVPVSGEALERAIELNGAAVEQNRQAFRWGRRAAHDLASVEAAAKAADPTSAPRPLATTLEEIVALRSRDLAAYQNEALARRYKDLVAAVEVAEAERTPGRRGLAEAVARNYYKLLAYKDEYEVARLFSDPAFRQSLENHFEGNWKLSLNLAPPLIAKRDPDTGHLLKREFGSWLLGAFRILPHFRFLRGTALDPFGRTPERKRERALIAEYEALLREILGKLDHENHRVAVALAALPEQIRGYGHVKDAAIEKAKAREAELLADFRAAPAATAAAAE